MLQRRIAPSARVTALLLAGLLAWVACKGGSVEQPSITLSSLELTPVQADLAPSATQQYAVTGHWSDGSTTSPTVDWTSTGGTIGPTGLYTAGASAGSFRVIATHQASGHADTGTVTITASPAVLTAVILQPPTASISTGATQQFSVTGNWSDGSHATPAVDYFATGGTISAGGLYTAGSTGGAFAVIATQHGGSLADTSAVTLTVPPPALTKVILTPPTASLVAGATQQFSVTGNWSDGTHTAPAVNYTATGGTITAGGLYTSGGTAGTFRVIAVQQGGTLADTSAVTITVPPPTLSQVVLTPTSVSLATAATQQFTVTGNWSDGSHTAPLVTYAATGGTITAAGLYTAGSTAGTFRVIATQQGGTLADTSAVTITSASGTTLFSEDFETTNFGSKGWYDQTTIPTSTAEHNTGSTRSMAWHWTTTGATSFNPLAAGAARHKFTPTSTLYISYWVKFTANFVGSGQTFHPHEFTVMTTESDSFAAPAHTPLTLLLETTWQGPDGVPRMESADGANVNTLLGTLPNDLTTVTEARAASGCNGNPDGLNVSCFSSGGGLWDNTKLKDAANPQFLSAAGAKNKSAWHHVEAYFQLNSISGGKGQLDGVMQYWYDGTLVIDEHGVQFRTGAHPAMLMNQFLAQPYIGNGSPLDQTEWIDDLLVRTTKP